jgi:hypothetical protein
MTIVGTATITVWVPPAAILPDWVPLPKVSVGLAATLMVLPAVAEALALAVTKKYPVVPLVMEVLSDEKVTVPPDATEDCVEPTCTAPEGYVFAVELKYSLKFTISEELYVPAVVNASDVKLALELVTAA